MFARREITARIAAIAAQLEEELRAPSPTRYGMLVGNPIVRAGPERSVGWSRGLQTRPSCKPRLSGASWSIVNDRRAAARQRQTR